MKDEETTEIMKLIIANDEAEAEAEGSITEYLMQRAATHGNRLGLQKRKVLSFAIAHDSLSKDYTLVFEVRRWF